MSNVRVELGFPLYGPSIVGVLEHQPCPQGGAQGPCENSGSDAKGPWGGRAMMSEDMAGGALLRAHWSVVLQHDCVGFQVVGWKLRWCGGAWS
eukprot:3936643-Rhodomonas_salina.2